MRALINRQRTRPAHIAASLAAMSILVASPAFAADSASFSWEDSRAQDVTAKTLDVLIVRPLAAIRVIFGALIFVPTFLISLPMGQEGFDGAYEILIDDPIEYAFLRDIGDMN
jgi:hypothetical protein